MSEEEPLYPVIPDPGYRFVYDSGLGFTTGLAGSSIFNLFGGLRRGGGLAGAARAVSARAPRAAGTMAAYFALCSAVHTAMDHARPNNEDLWNTFAAAGVSWVALGVRRGAAFAALVGTGLAIQLAYGTIKQTPRQQQPQPLNAPTTPAVNGFLGISNQPVSAPSTVTVTQLAPSSCIPHQPSQSCN